MTTTIQRLEQMQMALRTVMDALKSGDPAEAERRLLVIDYLMDRALDAERRRG